MEDNEKKSVLKIDLTEKVRVIIETDDNGELQDLFNASMVIINSIIEDYQMIKLSCAIDGVNEYIKNHPSEIRTLLGFK